MGDRDRLARDTYRRLKEVGRAIAAEQELARITERVAQIHVELQRHQADERHDCDRCRDLRTELYGKDSHRAQ